MVAQGPHDSRKAAPAFTVTSSLPDGLILALERVLLVPPALTITPVFAARCSPRGAVQLRVPNDVAVWP
ncbi:hypothetical protein CFE70_002102 [Pyrenophora teres f. teres 0-1]